MNCPLCQHSSSTLFDQDKNRSYHNCDLCRLVFVPRTSLVTPSEEKKRYDSHQNLETDPGYRAYLHSIMNEMRPFLDERMKGLDFGCGRTRLLETILEEAGHEVDSFDLYYHPDENIWNSKYDFIVLSEVIEHLAGPREVMERLSGLLNPGGKMFVKTKECPEEVQEFKNWFYKRDITHVQFFNQTSFRVLSSIMGLRGPEKIGEDLFLFKGQLIRSI